MAYAISSNVVRNQSILSCCSCAICMEIFDSYLRIPKILPCGHQFCDICLQILIANSNSKCPTCRADFDSRPTLVTNYSMLGKSEEMIITLYNNLLTFSNYYTHSIC
jgi:hypothetical protein